MHVSSNGSQIHHSVIRNFLRSDSSTSWNNDKPPPMFTVNAAAYRANNMSRYDRPDYRYNVPRFRTIVAMTNFFRTDGRSTQSYPFDKYVWCRVCLRSERADHCAAEDTRLR